MPRWSVLLPGGKSLPAVAKRLPQPSDRPVRRDLRLGNFRPGKYLRLSSWLGEVPIHKPWVVDVVPFDKKLPDRDEAEARIGAHACPGLLQCRRERAAISTTLLCTVLSDLRAEGVFPRFDGERLDSAESMICVGNARIGGRLGREP